MADNTDRGVTRRAFLAASGTTVGLGSVEWPRLTVRTAPLQEIIIGRNDLVSPASAAYVNRGGEPADAPLVRHLRARLPGFSEEDLALSGFETTAVADAPTHVESAALSRDSEWSINALAATIDTWLNGEQRDAASVGIDPAISGGAQWVTRGHDDSVDVLRLRATPPGPVLLTVAHGYESASLGPRSAVERYEGMMRERVRV